MKKFFVMFAIAGALVACNDNSTNKTGGDTTVKTGDTTTVINNNTTVTPVDTTHSDTTHVVVDTTKK